MVILIQPETIMTLHPYLTDHGKPVTIHQPRLPSPPSAWSDPLAVASVMPDGQVLATINGVVKGHQN